MCVCGEAVLVINNLASSPALSKIKQAWKVSFLRAWHVKLGECNAEFSLQLLWVCGILKEISFARFENFALFSSFPIDVQCHSVWLAAPLMKPRGVICSDERKSIESKCVSCLFFSCFRT